MSGPPDTTLDSQPPALTNLRNFSFTFHGTPAAGSSSSVTLEFNCSLDGVTPDRCTSPVDVAVGDGDHTFTVAAITEGVADDSPASATWHVDSTPPDTMVTSGPPSFDNSSTAMITFTGTPVADIAKFECALDGAAFATCTSPATLDNLVSGLHNFKVRAVDAAGNADPTPAQHSWTLDTSTPDTMITSGPAAGAVLNGSATFGFASNLGTAVFECSFDTGSFTACVSPISYNSLPGGPHSFTVRAKNPTTNVVDPTPPTRMWTVDATPPVATINSHPADPTNLTTPMFAFSSADTDVAMFECQIDGVQPFAACTSPFTGPALTDGLQTFRVRVTDNVGNQSTTTFTWTVDTTPPTVTITSGPSGNIGTTSTTFTFSTSGTPATVQCQLDGGAFAACTSPDTLTGLTDGAHVFTIKVTDAAGNSSTAVRMFTVTTVGPTVVITGGPTGPTKINTPTFTFTTMNATTIDCRFDGGTFSPCTSPFTAQALGEGLHTFEVRVRDAALNQNSATRSFTVDTLAPTVTITTGPSGPTNNASPTFTFVANGAPTATECRFDANAFAACTSPFVTSPALAQGAHMFEVRVTDAAGNTGNDTRAFNVVTTGPTVTITGGPNGNTNDSTPAWTFTTAGSPTTIQCKVDSGAFAACTSPFQSAALVDGSHTFTVQVSDAAMNTNSDSRTILLDTVAPTVTITAGPSGPTNVQKPAFSFSTAGAPTSIMCRFDTAALATCTSPFAPTVNLPDGPHVFEVVVADAAGNTSTATRAFTVNTLGPTVTITNAIPDPNNNRPTFTFTTTRSPTTIECAIDLGTFSACTSPFTSSPLGGGAHTFFVRVADTAGNTDLKSQMFSISTTAPSVAITAGPNGGCGTPATCNPSNNTTPTFAFTVGAGWSTLQCHTDSGALVDCSGGITVGQAGTGSFTVASALSSGGHSFEVVACNASMICASDIKAFTEDFTAPTIIITAGPSGLCPAGSGGPTCDPTSSNTPAFTFASAGGATTFECATIAGAGPATAFGPCGSTTTFTTTALADGQFTFTVRVTDSAFNQNTASKSFVIDTTPPIITVTAPFITSEPGGVFTQQPALSFSITELHPNTLQCSVDGGAYANCTSPFSSPSVLAEGEHRYSVQARDQAGNLTTLPDQKFIVDRTAPTVTISDPTPHGSVTSFTTASQPSFQVTVTDTNGGPNLTATPIVTTCSFNGTPGNCTIVGSFPGTATVTPSGSLGDNSAATLTIVATDATTPTGNAIPVTKTFTVDKNPPTLTNLVLTPADPAKTKPTLTFTVADDRPPLATVLCNVDGGANTDCSGGSFLPTGSLLDGSHTYNIAATDRAGNVTPQSKTFFLDTTAPTVTLFTGPTVAAPTNLATPLLGFTLTNAGSPAGPGAITTTCDFDFDTVLIAASCPTVGPFPQIVTGVAPVSALADGTHKLRVITTDAAGNQTIAIQSFLVDLVKPTISISTPTGGTIINNLRPTLTFAVSDNHTADTTTYQCAINGGGKVACPSGSFTPGSDLTPDGTFTYTVDAKDLAGNAATQASVTFIVDTTAPSVTVDTGPSNGTTIAVNTASYTFHGNDTNGVASAQCDSGGGFGACTTFSSTTTSANAAATFNLSALSEGAHTVQFKVTDRTNPALSNSPVTSIAFRVDTVAPVLGTTTVAPAVNGNGFITTLTPTFTFSATDATTPAGVTFTCSTDGGTTYNACTSPAMATFVGQGAHSFRVKAKDTVGNETSDTVANAAALSFTIDSINPVVAITAPTAGQLFTTAPTTAAITVTETNPDTQTCHLNGGTATACTTSFSIAGATEGPNTLVVTATDKAGNSGMATVAFTLDTAAPTGGTISGADTDKVNTLPTYTFSAQDVGTAMTATCQFNAGAAGPCTTSTPSGSAGMFSFMGTFLPTGAVQGDNVITVVISDGVGGAGHTTTLVRHVIFDNVPPSFAYSNSDGTIACGSGPTGTASVMSAAKPITITITDMTTSVATSSCNVAANGTCTTMGSPYTMNITAAMMGTAVTVTATDAANNTFTQTCTITAMAAIVITGGPRGPTNDRAIAYAFAASTEATAAGATPECSYDGGAFGACTTPTTYVVAQPTAGKVHTFAVRARTAKGVMGSPDKASFELDPIAMCLDGEQQVGKADLTALLDHQTASTIELWYRSHSDVPVFDLFTLGGAGLRYDAAAGFALELGAPTTKLGTAKPIVVAFAAPTGFTPQQWHHYALSLTATAATLFVDGAPLAQTSGKVGALPTLGAIAAAAKDVALDLVGPGAYRDLRISPTARAASAFTPTFPATTDKTTTVLFPMNEAKGTASSDARDGAPDLSWTAPATGWTTCQKAGDSPRTFKQLSGTNPTDHARVGM